MNKLKSAGATTVISNNFIKGIFSLIVLWFMFSSQSVLAEVSCDNGLSCTQTIELKPGWNSIFVQVKPDADATEEVFADLLDGDNSKVSSVWTWLAHRAKIDFIQDPNSEKLLSQEGWLRYFPEETKNSFLTNLYAIQGNRAYLVKLEGTASVTVSITGQPVMPRAQWQSNSFNHLGLHVDPENLPTFYDYFSASDAHNDQPIYQLVNNEWSLVDPLNTIIQSDVAYWVFSKTGSNYLGPIEVALPQVDRLEYGSVLEQFTAKIKNKVKDSQSISVQVLGNAPGMYYPNPDATATEAWLALPNPLTLDVASGGESRLPLGMRRADFALGEFNHVLQVTSAAGSRWLIPVTASAPKLNSLWVGSVTINAVSQVQNYQRNCVDTKIKTNYQTYDADGQEITLSFDSFAPNLKDTAGTGFDLCRDADGLPIADGGDTVTPVKDGGEFSFRVIVHREGETIRLLKDVIQMYKPAVVATDGTVTELGRYVLLTDDTLIPEYEGITLRDGEVVGKRISSMAYDFPGNSHPMSGSLDGALETTLVLAADSPTNPFRHHYHNDHKDKKDKDGVITAGGGFEVTRQMIFDNVVLPAEDTLTTNSLGRGREVIDGTYTEVISGLHKTPIILQGTYILRHAVGVDKLNQ